MFSSALRLIVLSVVLVACFNLTTRSASAQPVPDAAPPTPQAANPTPLQTPATFRLYDSTVFLLDIKDPAELKGLSLQVRDINTLSRGPSELLIKLYDPKGNLVTRQVLEDDGVNSRLSLPAIAGWDHEAWYYATCYSRGIEPAIKFSELVTPQRMATLIARNVTLDVPDPQKGCYRLVLAGSPDLVVTLQSTKPISLGVFGSPDWLHIHGDTLKKAYIYVPKGTIGVRLRILEMEQPYGRSAKIYGPDGQLLCSTPGTEPLDESVTRFSKPGAMDDQILTLQVASGPHDYMIEVQLMQPTMGERHKRGAPSIPAALCADIQTAKNLKSGAIYHDGQVFWQGYQVRLYDHLKTLTDDQKKLPPNLAKNQDQFISVGSHQSPAPLSADRILHDFPAHKNPQAINAALADYFEGMMLIGPADHVMHGRNLAYEMGTYSYFYHRPAWLLLQKYPDLLPKAAADAVRDHAIQIGDRLAFCRGIELVNGNSLASLLQGMRYCIEATKDPIQIQLFNTYWERFTTGGFGDRFGLGPSGSVQEGFGYDHHYGGYILRGWRAGLNDLADPRFQKVYDSILDLYSYTWSPEGALAPWSSRTKNAPAGGTYTGTPTWKGYGGKNTAGSVNNANEFIYAIRPNYYILTYFGRITPTWLGEGFHGQIGFSGGVIAQLNIPGKGVVLGSSLPSDYGRGTHPSEWRNFHIHTLAGQTSDGKPFVAANSEPTVIWDSPDKVTAAGEIRESSLKYTRSYTFAQHEILCEISLARSAVDKVYSIYGGMSGLRGNVDSCYELIPFVPLAPKGKISPAKVTLIGENTQPLGTAKSQPQTAHHVVIDRGGYGVIITLDQPRKVSLGQSSTVMIELCDKKTPAEQISLKYAIRPYIGEPTFGKPTPPKSRLLAELPADVEITQLSNLLANSEPVIIGKADNQAAKIHVGIAGDHLAIFTTVVDGKPTANATAWKGSCLEVFGNSPGKDQVGQIFLVPQTEASPAKTYVSQSGKQTATDKIKIITSPTKEGYSLSALIPLSLIKAELVEGKLRLEFQVTRMDKTGKSIPPINAFASMRAYQSNQFYGWFQTPASAAAEKAEMEKAATEKPAMKTVESPAEKPAHNPAVQQPETTTQAPAEESADQNETESGKAQP